uniref:Uncharacterized protein n=1 Tax=Anguilla anguilla TaxID=7936 RepID=A0A0E9RDA0_ANGAN
MAAQFLHFESRLLGQWSGTTAHSHCPRVKKCLEPLAVCHIN